MLSEDLYTLFCYHTIDPCWQTWAWSWPRSNHTQCHQAQQFFNQWWPQSALTNAFYTLCYRVGATQAWTTLQGLLGVTATGALDQATFQALLSNNNHALLAQQLLASITTPLSGK
ncbi:unnamed protein product [Rotaria sp. Silwood1]|nr:unnamed protein product [Rotaria sp. Silwood1]